MNSLSSINSVGFYKQTQATLFVAGGNGTAFTIAYSTDGQTWTGVSGSTSIFNNCFGFAYGNGTWVAVGNGNNTLAYSTNGTTWTGLGKTIFSGSNYSKQGKNIIWNGTRFVAVGQGTINSIAYSTNGQTWTGVTSSTSILNPANCIAYGNGTWVAGGQGTYTLAYSTDDGITWSGVTNSKTSIFSSQVRDITWNGTCFVAAGYGSSFSIAYSTDGQTWTGVANSISSIFSAGCEGISWNGSVWVACGEGTSNTIAVSSSTIPTSWTVKGKFGAIKNYNAAWSTSSWVSGGSGTNTLTYSLTNNANTWTNVTNSTSIFSSNANMVIYNSTLNIWIAVGDSTNTIAWSSDGTNWNGLGKTIFSGYGYVVISNTTSNF